jgi:hypothetical protein
MGEAAVKPSLMEDPDWLATLYSIGDLLNIRLAKIEVLTSLLVSKGLLSKNEIDRAIAAIPSETMDEVSKSIREDLRQLIAWHRQHLQIIKPSTGRVD